MKTSRLLTVEGTHGVVWKSRNRFWFDIEIRMGRVR